MVSFEERIAIQNRLEKDRNLDILQKMALCHYFGISEIKSIHVSARIVSWMTGILVIIYGIVWAVIGFVEGYNFSQLSEHSAVYGVTAEIYFIGSPIWLFGTILIGVSLIGAGANPNHTPYTFSCCAVGSLIMVIAFGLVCVFIINLIGGMIIMVVVVVIGIFMIIKAQQALRQQRLVGRNGSFNVLCVAFLYKAYGSNWLNMPEYNHLSRYHIDKIRETVDKVYKRYPDIN